MFVVPIRIAVMQHHDDREKHIHRELEHFEVWAAHGELAIANPGWDVRDPEECLTGVTDQTLKTSLAHRRLMENHVLDAFTLCGYHTLSLHFTHFVRISTFRLF